MYKFKVLYTVGIYRKNHLKSIVLKKNSCNIGHNTFWHSFILYDNYLINIYFRFLLRFLSVLSFESVNDFFEIPVFLLDSTELLSFRNLFTA